MQTVHRISRPIGLVILASLIALIGACGGDTDTTSDDAGAGVRLGSVDDALKVLADPPEDLVVLDVRTLEEFQEARLADATMIDFYQDDFADQIADLDPEVPYLLYCRSGNRSGQAAELMEQLGFTNVLDVDGGINAWLDSGQAVVAG